MAHYLLIGAGFTRNWGGPLSDEVTGSLLGTLHNDPALSAALRKGPFESAFQGFQAPASDSQRRFQGAVVDLFQRLNVALLDVTFEFSNEVDYQVARFLAKFDAIFSLNQDLLLENHYLERLPPGGRWNGAVVAGVKPTALGHDHYGAVDKIWVPEQSFSLPPRMQPLVKLHGSMNWRAASGDPILVMGNAKSGAIQSFEVLLRCHDFFASSLNQTNSKLMVIGYSFQDDHINEVIERASSKHGLGTYIVDPSGLRVLKDPKMAGATIPGDPRPIEEIKLVGVTSRPFATIFSGKDQFAFKELGRFFN